MSTFREFRNDFIKLNPAEQFGPDAIGIFVSQSTATGEIYIAGITVPYTTTQGTLRRQLADTHTIYVEYAVATGSSYLPASGSSFAIRIIEIPVKEVQSRKDHYFFEPKYSQRFSELLASFGDLSPTKLKVAFAGPENFWKDDYNAGINVVEDARKSRTALRVDREPYAPTHGTYQDKMVPANFEVLKKATETRYLFPTGSLILTASTLRNKELIDSEAFADTQDSNYTSKAWNIGRYIGSELDNLGIIGNEPALGYYAFQGAIYPTGSAPTPIKAIDNSDRPLEQIYFVNFASGSVGQGSKHNDASAHLPLDAKRAIDLISPSTNGNRAYTILYREEGKKMVKITEKLVYHVSRNEVLVTNGTGRLVGIL